MVKRNIIKIDRSLCTGCGNCVTACAEGAIELKGGKAEVVSDTFCDGLGACLEECPTGALTIEERDAPEFNESKVKEHLQQKQELVITPCAFPSSGPRMFKVRDESTGTVSAASQLSTWPIQLRLVPTNAPYLWNASLLIAADCTAFACGSMQGQFMKGRVALIGCPKLDDNDAYVQKLTDIISTNPIKDITLVHMEVPCCRQLKKLVLTALQRSGRQVPLTEYVVKIEGGEAVLVP
jgi:Fe-S-cluster-containing hydrogenase component 2